MIDIVTGGENTKRRERGKEFHIVHTIWEAIPAETEGNAFHLFSDFSSVSLGLQNTARAWLLKEGGECNVMTGQCLVKCHLTGRWHTPVRLRTDPFAS